MSGEQKGRHKPDGKEDGTDLSLNLTAPNNALEGTAVNQSEAVEACTSEVTPINNQLSDDSLEDDAVTDNPVAANAARDNKVDTSQNETNTKTETSDLIEAVNQSNEVTLHNGEETTSKVTDKQMPLDNNETNSVTAVVPNYHVANKSDVVKKDVSKATTSGGSLQNNSIKLSQSSSRFSTSSRIPVLKGSKGKPSPLAEPHKASTSSVTMTTPGELPQQEAYSPAVQSSENTDTPVSVALQEIPSSDSLQVADKTGNTRKETSLSNKQKEIAATMQAYHRGWNGQKYTGKPSQLPVATKRRQDGRVLKNSNSFNSYVHEQMAITMAMMEANFEGVGLSNTQQERVEELRAGLDSFSLTNITAPVEEQKTVFMNSRHHHSNHDYSGQGDAWLSEEHHKQSDTEYYGMRPAHDRRMQLLHRSQSNPNHGSYGNSVHNQRRGSDIPHNDSFGMRKSGSYLQQQLDRRGSYLLQSKLGQSIKVFTGPLLGGSYCSLMEPDHYIASSFSL